MPVNASMHIGFTASKSGTVPNIGNSLWAGTIEQTLNFANGTGAAATYRIAALCRSV